MHECKLAENLVRLRTMKGITQDEVAKNLSVSNKTVSKWETGVSLPDIPMLIALSTYFCVTADTLLGLSADNRNDVGAMIHTALEGLDWKTSVLKAFEAEKAIIPAVFDAIPYKDEAADGAKVYPSTYSPSYRSQISTNEFFQFTASSEAVNVSVTLLGNKDNFSWLENPQNLQKMTHFFRFLSEEDALSVLYFIHSANCARAFTADFVSANTAVPEKKVAEILERFCEVGDCVSFRAHLVEGDVTVYECGGDGMVLAILSLVYDRMYGRPSYHYCYNGGCKMIGGK